MVFLNAGPSGHVKEDSKFRRSTWKPSVHIISPVCHLVRVFIALFIHQQVNDTVCQWHPSLPVPLGITTAARLALGPAEGLSWSKDLFPVGGLVAVGPRSSMLHSSEMLDLV